MTRTFSPTGSMCTARILPDATRITTRFVLITGGKDASSKVTSSAELYDAKAGTFTVLPRMSTPRVFHAAVAIKNRFVLIAGGEDNGFAELASADFSTSKRALSLPAMETERAAPSSALIKGHFVLIAGGLDKTATAVATAELFDLNAKTFTPVGNMSVPRITAFAAPFPGNRILVTGGSKSNQAKDGTDTAEIFTFATKAFTPAGMMSDPRIFPSGAGFH